MIVVMVLVLLLGGCELRFQDPFSHPADDADTRIFDDESGSGTASGDGSDGGADGDSGGDSNGSDATAVPFRTVAIGQPGAWDGIEPLIIDPVGDSRVEGSGLDISAVYLAQDSMYVYWRLDLADENPSTEGWMYRLLGSLSSDGDRSVGDFEASVSPLHGDAILFQVDHTLEWQGLGYPDGYAAISTFVEMKFPLHRLGNSSLGVRGRIQRDVGDIDPDSTERRNVRFDLDSSPLPNLNWQLLTSDAPMGQRTNYGFTAHDDRLWVINGDVWSSTDGIVWDYIAASPFTTGFGAIPVGSYEGLLYAISDGTLWSSADGINWDDRGTAPQGAYAARQLVEYNGYLWSIGENIAAWYDGSNWQSVPMPEVLPDEQFWGEHVPLVFGDALWLVGGEMFQNGIMTSSDGQNWVTVINNVGFTRRHWAAGGALGNGMLILGGWVGGPTNDVLYSTNGIIWITSSGPFLPRERFLAARIGDTLYFYGGHSDGVGEVVPADVWSVRIAE
jgi:hypothetical protein